MTTEVKYQFNVEGMMCQKNCASTVQKSLENLDEVLRAKVIFTEKLADITVYPQKLNNDTEQLLLNAIEDVGFEAKCILRPDIIPHYRFQVEGMMCQKSCANTVQNALNDITGVKTSQVKFATKYADVWLTNPSYFNHEMKTELLDTIESIGFEATFLSSCEPSPCSAEDCNELTMKEKPDVILHVKGMISSIDCPKKIQNILNKVDGVMSVEVDFNKSIVNIYGFADADILIESLIKHGYLASTQSKVKKQTVISDDKNSQLEYNDYLELKILGMSCANCSKGIEKEISVLHGISSIKIALLAQKAEIIHNANIISSDSIIDHIVELGYEAFFILTKNRSEPNKKEYTFIVTGMSCTACTTKIEECIYNTFSRQIINDVKVTLMNNKLIVNLSNESVSASQKTIPQVTSKHTIVGPRDILDLVESLGYGCKYMTKSDMRKDANDGDDDLICSPVVCNPCTSSSLSELQVWARLLLFASIFGIPVVLMHLFVPHIPILMKTLSQQNEYICHGTLSFQQTLMMCLNVPIQFGVGYKFYRSAFLGALHYNFGMDFLIVLGTSITFIYSSLNVLYGCTHMDVNIIKHLFFDASGMLFLFVTLGKFFEAYAKGKTVSAIASLLSLQPLQATLVEENEMFITNQPTIQEMKNISSTGQDIANSISKAHQNEKLRIIDIGLVQKGDILKLLPGSRVPTDGVIISGSSSIDESMITGESIPVSKAMGDFVFGSTINITNVLYIEVTAIHEENALSQIISLVESAQTNKAPIQAYADKMASYFTPFVLTIAMITFTAWYICCTTHIVPVVWYQEEFENPMLFSMLFAISVIVISCPCALGLATPTAIMVGSALSAQNGVLIKGGPSFEVANKIKTIIFDKTGTLTLGKPVLTNIVVINNDNNNNIKCYNYICDNENNIDNSNNNNNNDYMNTMDSELYEQMINDQVDAYEMNSSKLRIIKLAASIEQGSQHPLALAILNAASKLNMSLYPLELDNNESNNNNDHNNNSNSHSGIMSPKGKGKGFKVTNGMGIECSTPEGIVAIGNRAFFETTRLMIIAKEIDRAMYEIETQGKTAVCVSCNDIIIGVLGIADAVKSDALTTIAALHALNIDVWMVTGDNITTANAIAKQLDIPSECVLAGVLPAQKASKIIQLQNACTGNESDRRYVAMVGDGINDSPALAQADLGIAVGTGTQVAIEAADMVLMKDSLQDVVVALDLAKFVFRRIRINFGWAVIYNVIAIPFAAGIWFPWTRMFISPQYAGLAMAFSSVSVVLSSLALRWYKRPEHLFKNLKNNNKNMKRSTIAINALQNAMSIVKTGAKTIMNKVKKEVKQKLIGKSDHNYDGDLRMDIEYSKLTRDGDHYEEDAESLINNII